MNLSTIYTVLIVLFANDSAMGLTYRTPEACAVALRSAPQALAARFETTVLDAYCAEGDE